VNLDDIATTGKRELKVILKITVVWLRGLRSNEFEEDMSRILKAN